MTNAIQSVAQRLNAAQAEVIAIEKNELPALLAEHGAVGLVAVDEEGGVTCLGEGGDIVRNIEATVGTSPDKTITAAMLLKRLLDQGHTLASVDRDEVTYTVR